MPSPFPGMDPYLEGPQWTSCQLVLSVEIARQLNSELASHNVARTSEAVTPDGTRHLTIEIRDAAERQLVTAIEVLSPTNKHGEGREEYRIKRQRILLSPAHLMEIDLLRTGD